MEFEGLFEIDFDLYRNDVGETLREIRLEFGLELEDIVNVLQDGEEDQNEGSLPTYDEEKFELLEDGQLSNVRESYLMAYHHAFKVKALDDEMTTDLVTGELPDGFDFFEEFERRLKAKIDE